MTVSDGPIGVRGTGDDGLPSAQLPAPSATAATWDVDLQARLGTLMAAEARRKAVDVILAPVVNLQRSPVGGRHFECLSEDPFLTARLAVAFVDAIQEQGIAACVKHFIGNETETDRTEYLSRIDERTLREVYLAPFEAVVDAGVWTIMAAYNGLTRDGVDAPATAHHPLLTGILKDEWGFDGIVVSDWLATKTVVEPALGGLDLVMPGPGGPWADGLLAAVRVGLVPESVIDDKVARIVRLAERVGALSGLPGETLPFDASGATEDPAGDEVVALLTEAAARSHGRAPQRGRTAARRDRPRRPAAHRPHRPQRGRALHPGRRQRVRHAAARERAARGAPRGLPRGRGLAAPRRRHDRRRAAHPRRDPHDARRGARHPHRVPRRRGRRARVRAASGCREPLVPGARRRRGLRAGAHRRRPRGGRHPRGGARTRRRPPHHGRRRLRSASDRHVGVEVVLNSSYSNPGSVEAIIEVAAPRRVRVDAEVQVVDGESYGRFVRLTSGTGRPVSRSTRSSTEAVAAAAAADLAVVVVGTNAETESEGWDRPNLDLPGRQNELVRRVVAANPRTIVVVNAGAPVLLPWLDEVPAVLWAWLPGQEAGRSLADVLSGAIEPTGRLPWTLPAREEDVPVPDALPVDGVIDYAEGLDVGHRAWDRLGRTPAREFGFGLGYADGSTARSSSSTRHPPMPSTAPPRTPTPAARPRPSSSPRRRRQRRRARRPRGRAGLPLGRRRRRAPRALARRLRRRRRGAGRARHRRPAHRPPLPRDLVDGCRGLDPPRRHLRGARRPVLTRPPPRDHARGPG